MCLNVSDNKQSVSLFGYSSALHEFPTEFINHLFINLTCAFQLKKVKTANQKYVDGTKRERNIYATDVFKLAVVEQKTSSQAEQLSGNS